MLPRPSSHDQAQTKALLQAMGIPPDIPREAVDQAWRAWSRCTENDVLSMAGFLAWGVPMRFMRDKLRPLSWSVGREKNFETVVSPDHSFQVASAPGNSHTGDPYRMPSTRTEKGPQTQLVVAINNQLSFDDPQVGRPRETEQPAVQTWFLLHYYDAKDQEIRMELSRGMTFTSSPAKRGGHGVISHFEPRIILNSISVVNGTVEEQDHAPEEQIDIVVNRRTA